MLSSIISKKKSGSRYSVALPSGKPRTVALPDRLAQFTTIHPISALTRSACGAILGELECVSWQRERHVNHPTVDQNVKDLGSKISEATDQVLRRQILPCMSATYRIAEADLYVEEVFVVKYDENGQAGLGYHRDANLLSFSILLSDPGDFSGGGTHFRDSSRVYHADQGDALVHCGQLLHCALPILSGQRCVLVGFIGVSGRDDIDVAYMRAVPDADRNPDAYHIEKVLRDFERF